jgi:phenylpropionate dioxygenase-like ring-hydroxylating dioxygenase large terminal subunit
MPDGETRTVRAEARFGQGFLTDTWYLAALSADLKPGKLIHVEMLGEPLALGRARSGALFALRDV